MKVEKVGRDVQHPVSMTFNRVGHNYTKLCKCHMTTLGENLMEIT